MIIPQIFMTNGTNVPLILSWDEFLSSKYPFQYSDFGTKVIKCGICI